MAAGISTGLVTLVELHKLKKGQKVQSHSLQSNRDQLSSAASPEILHHTAMKTSACHSFFRWEIIMAANSPNVTYTFLLKGWENILFSLGINCATRAHFPQLDSIVGPQSGTFRPEVENVKSTWCAVENLTDFNPFHSWAQKVYSPNLSKSDCMSDVARICSIITFHLSKLWKVKLSILCDVIFLVRLQGNFDIDHSQGWKG